MTSNENQAPRAGGGAPKRVKRASRRRSPLLQPKLLVPALVGSLGLIAIIVVGVVLSEDEPTSKLTAVAATPPEEQAHDPRYVQQTAEQKAAIEEEKLKEAERSGQASGPTLALSDSVEDRLKSAQQAKKPVDDVSAGRAPSIREGTVEAARQTLQDFQTASSPEDLLPLVRKSESTAAMIREYYARPGVVFEKFANLKESTAVAPYRIDGKEFLIAKLLWEDFSNCFAVLEWNGSRFLLDWQTLVEYDAFPWEQYCEERPFGAESFRVLAAPDDFYTGRFTDSDKFQCLRLSKSRDKGALYGYFEKDDPALESLQSIVTEAISLPMALNLEIAFVPGAGRNQVRIKKMHHVGWVMKD